MIPRDNPLLIRFWRRERRWFWLRSSFAPVAVVVLAVIVCLQWGLWEREWQVWPTVAMGLFVGVMPLCTMGPLGSITREVRRLRRRGWLTDLVITPMTGRDYLWGLMFPAVAPLAVMFTAGIALTLIHVPIYLMALPEPAKEIYGGGWLDGEELTIIVISLVLSVVYAWIQLLWSASITLRCCLAFPSPHVAQLVAALFVVVLPLMLCYGLGDTGFLEDGEGYIASHLLFSLFKLFVALILLADMRNNFHARLHLGGV